MCDFNNGFILCKCNDSKVIVHNKKSRRNKNKDEIEYKWILNKHLGKSKKTEIGRYTMPLNEVGNGLTSKFVLSELNKRNCFDFAYNPKEGDNLLISEGRAFDRIEFIFRNGKWEEDHYSPFDHICEKLHNGVITKTV